MIYLSPGAAMRKVTNGTEGEEEGCVEEHTVAKRRETGGALTPAPNLAGLTERHGWGKEHVYHMEVGISAFQSPHYEPPSRLLQKFALYEDLYIALFHHRYHCSRRIRALKIIFKQGAP